MQWYRKIPPLVTFDSVMRRNHAITEQIQALYIILNTHDGHDDVIKHTRW